MATPSQHQKLEEQQQVPSLDRPLKDGERLLAPSRRPDGTLRKPIRIRAGYTPQDEVAIYQSKGTLFRKGLPHVPPGYDPIEDGPSKPKTKSAKKNQKRKEKKHQTDTASFVKYGEAAERSISDDTLDSGSHDSNREDVEAVADQMSSLSVSAQSAERSERASDLEKVNVEKRIRALKKKIRAIESLKESTGALNSEQAEKLSRLELWQKELSDLEAQWTPL
ncbi:hypothetical protein GOP47_0013917 [Adiantum capillus-veneris]|uniref:WIBG Mago-binding domain-containing protein n=1 Tax=Adiantum capillus-veneris TaxID=13818 RepID=A0A9D4ZG84_ADICA|nr:hypothetical protein GOP47_0013917 [Adiantum capillus-veneris]